MEREPGTLDDGAAAEVETPRHALLRWLPGLILLLGVVLVVFHRAEEQRFARLLAEAAPTWLLAAAFFQAGTYFCAAGVWQRALKRHGVSLGLWQLAPLGLAKVFTDQAAPSVGVSGSLLVMQALVRRGVDRGLAMAALVIGLLSYYVAFLVAILLSLAILWALGDLDVLILSFATAAAILAGAVPLAVLWLQRGGRARLPRFMQRVRALEFVVELLAEAPANVLLDRKLLAEAAVYQMGVFVLDAATLATLLLAVGERASPGAVFVSFIIATAVADVIIVPGGFGTFDGTCVAMLRLFSVPVEAGLTVAILLRGFTFFLPMIPGLLLARRELRQQ